ncbi:MAG TPA: FAD-binding and (Fe-S)-binding domain-containing protein [Casimicrobiaceae bacterium]|jgi:D-lactate dehydrogenase|nr:FAD-binding and (Fe-S)-binding domain-containing protein [Casimicrobiaceae bacterium]
MLPSRYRAFERTLHAPYDALYRLLSAYIPVDRLITDPLRLLTWGTDASFYRLVPHIAVVVESEDEVVRLLRDCARLGTPVTFRAAGTSLSGQAITDSVLVLLGDNWRGCEIGPAAETVTLQPGVVGAAANRRLARFSRKIGPDPASIDAAMIGGIAANNASGMCCGTAQNSYHTLAGLRVVLASGTVLDTRDAASRAAFLEREPELFRALDAMARTTRGNETLAARIRHKFRLKNTTGYSLNALVDFDDPIDVLAHLMIGSEGTLGFISELTYVTVPEYANKASALILFDDLETACRAVTLLKSTPVAAVELADRAALRSVEGKPGLPDGLVALGSSGAALLVETRAGDLAGLGGQIGAIEAALAGVRTFQPVCFSTDGEECARLWNVRKGMFPSVGAMREVGTTVIIEDVAFPVPRLAEATLDLQRLLAAHGYPDAIIFGHALEGNLHFVFTQDFNVPAEVQRYSGFMDALCRMVVEKYDGSLKAEHGTGRNIAPFVELEWGAEAYGIMRAIKQLFDPNGLLNPGVVINDDRDAHLKNLKPLPECDPIVDKCIECGFCEPKCPSHKLTLSPRQRIVGWREITRLEHEGETGVHLETMHALYGFHGIDTCAACGLCATACPVGIETGALIKALRGRRASPVVKRVAAVAGDHFGAVVSGVRVGLAAANALRGLVGAGVMKTSLDGMRAFSGGRLPKWSPALPRAVNFRPRRGGHSRTSERIVYFPSCAARNMGTQRSDEEIEALPVVAERLFAKAGFEVVYPERLGDLCCGQPFESKGLFEAADRKSAELEAVLRDTSENGQLPIVFDTSPCAYRMKRYLAGRLAVQDSIEFVHDFVLPRVRIEAIAGPVAIHPVCSLRKMGTADKLAAVAARCSRDVVQVDEVLCCGFAGEKGFSRPELNEHALRHLKSALPVECVQGYSSSRTCEIGLSEYSGFPYRSIICLVDACARVRVSDAPASEVNDREKHSLAGHGD